MAHIPHGTLQLLGCQMQLGPSTKVNTCIWKGTFSELFLTLFPITSIPQLIQQDYMPYILIEEMEAMRTFLVLNLHLRLILQETRIFS